MQPAPMTRFLHGKHLHLTRIWEINGLSFLPFSSVSKSNNFLWDLWKNKSPSMLGSDWWKYLVCGVVKNRNARSPVSNVQRL